MNLEEFAMKFGLPGLLILVWYLIERIRLNRHYASEDKKTDALTAGFTSLGSKLDTHARADIESHGEMTDRLSRIEGVLVPLITKRKR